MAMTLTGFVYDNAGNAISGATVQGYVMADDQTSGTTAESSTTTNGDGKWAITTSTASRIPMDVKITYGSNTRWLKAGDKLNVTDMTVTGTLTVGEDAAGFDFQLYSDRAGDGILWDADAEVLQLTGADASTVLDVLDGDVRIVDKLYFYDRGGEYLSSDGSTLTITGATTIGALSLTSMSSNWTNASRTVADMGIITTIDINGGTIDGAVIGGASAAAVTGTAVTGTSLVGGTVAGTTGTFSGVVDITLVTDASDATGDTGALRTEGGASIAKKLYVGDDLSVGGDLTVTGDLNIDGTTTTVDSTTVAVGDSMILFAKDQGTSADAVDFGIYGKYGESTVVKYAGIFRDVDATNDPWTFFDGNQAEPGTTVNTGGTGYALAAITAAEIVGTTIDAGTDFTIGDTVITDGVVTDSSGLQLAANLDINGTVDISSTVTLGTVAAAGTDTDKFLVLDGSGNVDYRTGTQVLSDIGGTGATALDDVGTGDAAATLATTVGNITLDAQATDADVVIKVDDNGSAVTAVTFDGSDEGNAIFVNDVQLKSDSALLEFGADLDTTLLHTDGTGLTLNSTNKLTFGDVASFIQQSADGTLRIDGEAIIDLNASTKVDVSATLNTANLTIAGAQGSDGEVLTSTGSGVAWEAASGGASQANQAAIEGETNQDTYIPPDLIKHSPGVAKAWAKFDGSVSTPVNEDGGYGVDAITDAGTGDYTMNWTVDFSNEGYSAVVSSKTRTCSLDDDYSVSAFNFATRESSTSDHNKVDSAVCTVVAFGDQ